MQRVMGYGFRTMGKGLISVAGNWTRSTVSNLPFRRKENAMLYITTKNLQHQGLFPHTREILFVLLASLA